MFIPMQKHATLLRPGKEATKQANTLRSFPSYDFPLRGVWEPPSPLSLLSSSHKKNSANFLHKAFPPLLKR